MFSKTVVHDNYLLNSIQTQEPCIIHNIHGNIYAEDEFNKANDLYRNNKFEEAAKEYSAIN